MLNQLHKTVLEVREEMRSSGYGFFHLADHFAKKNNVPYDAVIDLFKEKYPNLYPLQEVFGRFLGV